MMMRLVDGQKEGYTLKPAGTTRQSRAADQTTDQRYSFAHTFSRNYYYVYCIVVLCVRTVGAVASNDARRTILLFYVRLCARVASCMYEVHIRPLYLGSIHSLSISRIVFL